jgi:bacterioferritin
MQGEKPIIELLNAALTLQLTAINQYFLHARMCKNWGLEQLNQHEYGASIVAMKQADALVERVLFLEGLPNLQNLGRLRVGENAQEIFDCDLILESEIRSQLQSAIADCEKLADYVSRELLEELLEKAEARIDWLETQRDLIAKVGLPNYLQSAM